ncbi:probable cardiolipin synthase (CMP-forming) [Lucilia sericata]|uniref:probable cardiolipin synthase (CMP-forming) n=1 Tax=Lucilia sericata TaxID=13632 RepID=UPI0018A82399|nr:probable cardiolipin synthase (CMP-forming) [Lucilia sericata]XP_037812530.1 probable cardiolipin synthase (CMP-forming) [Lucilia sericata]
MLPATIFRQVSRHPSGLCKGLTELVGGAKTSSFPPPTAVINCLNRYAAATGFIRISFLDINQYRNWDVATLRMYADSKKHSLHMKTLKGRDILQGVIDKKRESFIERKNVIVGDIREAKHKVQERMREKMEEVYEKENIMTIPNLLTMSRMILSPYIGYVIVDGHYSMAISLLAVAGITDLLDGQIARRWPSQASKAGSFLDPAADKVLMGSLVISMGYCDLLPLWLAGVVLFRDVFLIAAGFVIRYISLPPPRTFSRYFDATHVTAQLEPTFISKVNTGVQLAAVGISLGAPVWHYMDHVALHGLWYLTGATTVAAALSYVVNKNTFKILAKNNNTPKTSNKT